MKCIEPLTTCPRLDSFIGLCAILLSCNQPLCENTNSIFDTYAPDTNEYKNELALKLQSTDNQELSYWFDRFESQNSKEYILVDIQGEKLCAKGLLLVNDWSKLDGIKKSQGQGYRGAELRGLKISVEKDSTEIELVLEDIDYIID